MFEFLSANRVDDADLLEVFLAPVRKCALYKPAFGQSGDQGVSFEQFRALYGSDMFYCWLGLDTSAVYAAHKAAGGLTSVYRQLGVGCERLFRTIIVCALGLSLDQVSWGYEYAKPNGSSGVHTLDARLESSHLDTQAALRLEEWMRASLSTMGRSDVSASGAVFEVRQGYKSADSKRQNADLRFGMRAYQENLMPVFALMLRIPLMPIGDSAPSRSPRSVATLFHPHSAEVIGMGSTIRSL